MKKILFSIIAIAIMAIGIISCDSDEFTEADAQQNQLELLAFQDSLMKDSMILAQQLLDQASRLADSIQALQELRDSLAKLGIIEYSVKVFNASENSTSLKSANDAGIEGVDVTIAQHGQTWTLTTDASGMVIFDDMRIGVANVTIQSADYTDVSYIADITPGSVDCNDCPRYHVASAIAVFELTGATTAVISGKATIETDLTDSMPEVAENVTVIASIDVNNTAFDKYVIEASLSGSHEYVADIEHMSYADVWQAVVTDENGLYTINVPSSPDGVPYLVSVSDFVADQTLYMDEMYDVNLVPGLQTVRTVFSEGETASKIPTVAPVMVSIEAPNGVTNRLPETPATAVAVVTTSGVEALHLNSAQLGYGYTQAPNIEFTSTYGEGAEATATIDAQGRVNDVVVTTQGIGYDAASSAAFVESAEHADLTANISNSINAIDITAGTGTGGSGYVAAPAVTIVGDGAGATAEAVMDQIVKDFTITNAGANYEAAPIVKVTGGGATTYATAAATLSDVGTVTGIEILTPIYYPSTTATVDIELHYVDAVNGDGGQGATATASLVTTDGRVSQTTYTITDGGAGYVNPTVIIDGEATATATVVGGVITAINVINQGSGYSAIPNITIIPDPTSTIATPAAVSLALEFPIGNFNITNGGTGYHHANTIVYVNDLNVSASLKAKVSRGIASIALAAPNNGGAGYIDVPTVEIITATGDAGSGATATASLTQTVKEINVTNGGSGYLAGNTQVSIAAPADATGTQAEIDHTTAIIYEGILDNVTVNDGGSNYTALPYANLAWTFTNPAATTNVDPEITLVLGTDSTIASVTVDNPGYGLSGVTFDLKTFKTAASGLTVETNPNAGQIEQINVLTAGKGYTVAPIVEIDDLNGVASGATAVAEISNGVVTNITITNPGTGYYTAPTIKLVVPNYATQAMAEATVNAEGVITKVDLVTGKAGMGYDTVPAVTFTGLGGIGSGATAIAVVENGAVKRIDLTNGGAGYVAQNRPGLFGGTPGTADADGEGFAKKEYSGASGIYRSGQTYVVDYYLGTGVRVDQY